MAPVGHPGRLLKRELATRKSVSTVCRSISAYPRAASPTFSTVAVRLRPIPRCALDATLAMVHSSGSTSRGRQYDIGIVEREKGAEIAKRVRPADAARGQRTNESGGIRSAITPYESSSTNDFRSRLNQFWLHHRVDDFLDRNNNTYSRVNSRRCVFCIIQDDIQIQVFNIKMPMHKAKKINLVERFCLLRKVSLAFHRPYRRQMDEGWRTASTHQLIEPQSNKHPHNYHFLL